MKGKTILIDADSLCFLPDMDINEAIDKLENKIDKIKKLAGTDKYKLFLTIGNNSFRYKLQADYKANRIDKPRHENVSLLKKYLIENHDAIYDENLEADDLVCDAKRSNPNDIIASIDKDVLYNLSGKHINLYNFEWVYVSVRDARDHFNKQMLYGDRTDNIESLIKHIGPVNFKNYIKGSELTIEQIIYALCVKKHINYKDRYKMIYCGSIKDEDIKDEGVELNLMEKSIISHLVMYSNHKKQGDNEKTINRSLKKEKKVKEAEFKDLQFTFGKYKGKLISEVKKENINYLKWVVENVDGNSKIINEIKKLLK